MKDEEKAEEYCNNEEPFVTTESGEKLYTENDLKYAYLAGLKSGRLKWHNLMNDPNDLPAKRQHILCYTSDPWCHNQKGLKNVKHCDVEMGTYMGAGEWYMGCYHTCVPPKAWCEIPKYEG